MNLPTNEDWDKLYTANGLFGIRLLFREYSSPEKRKKYPPLFTLKTREHEGLPSAYQVYMDSTDEYDAAMKIVPDMRVWDALKDADWFMNGDPRHSFKGLVSWREHMRQRDASMAKEALLNKAKKGDTTAAKAILQESKKKAPVGRKGKKTTPAQKATVSRIKDFQKKQEKK